MRVLVFLTISLFSFSALAFPNTEPRSCQVFFASNVEMSGKKWSEIEENYIAFFKDFLARLRGNLLIAKQEGDVIAIKEAQSMYDRAIQLGFVDPGSIGEPWEIPSLKDFQHHFLALSETNRRQWNLDHPDDPISKDQLIYPAFSFYNKSSNQWLVLRLGDEIPPGFEYNMRKLVPGKVLYPAISSGLFPLMLQGEDVGGIGAHDFLGHFSSYAFSPDYARSYRAIAQQIQNAGGWLFLRPRLPMLDRVTYFNEFHAGVDGEVFGELLASFGLEFTPQSGEHEYYSYDVVYNQVKALSNRKLRQLLKALSENKFSFLQLHGGVASDRIDRNYEATVFENSMEIARQTLRSEFFSPTPGFSLTDIIIKRKSPQAVAFVITLALNFSLLSNTDWEDAITLIEYPEHTRLGYIFDMMNLPKQFIDKENRFLGFGSFFAENWWQPLRSPSDFFMTMKESTENIIRNHARTILAEGLLDEAKERLKVELMKNKDDAEARQRLWDAYDLETIRIMNETPLPSLEEANRILNTNY